MRALLLVTSAAALSAPSRRFAELAPLKAAMLAKSWRAKLAEVDQKVGILPDLDGTATGEVGVLRFGPELARRAATGAQLEWLFDAGMGLAGADKSAEPLKARAALAPLVCAGASRGARARVYSSLSVSGGAPAALSVVEAAADAWSVLALAVQPEERNLEIVAAAEAATLNGVAAAARAAGASKVRVLASVAPTLAAAPDELGLAPDAADPSWLALRHAGADLALWGG